MLIACAFAALLTVLGLSISDIARQTRSVHATILELEGPAQRRTRALEQLRGNLTRMALAVRDLAIEPAQDSPSLVNEVDSFARALRENLSELEQAQDPREAGAVRELHEDIELYSSRAVDLTRWNARSRRENGRRYLQQQLAPVRQNVLNALEVLDHREREFATERRARMGRAFVRLYDSFQTTLVLALLAGLAISTLTVWRVRQLEQQAELMQRQAKLDGERLRVLSHNLVRLHEDERKALSRELHDEVGQLMTAIQMTFLNIESGKGDADRHIQDGKELTARAVAVVRNISMGLRPSILDDLGLGPAVEWQAREFSKRSGVPVDLSLDGQLEQLSEQQQTCLFRVIQEALTNCARHAEASRVRVTLHAGSELTSLTVEDDGKGFDSSRRADRGLGLFGMEERVREIGGRLSIVSNRTKGTLLKVVAPARKERP